MSGFKVNIVLLEPEIPQNTGNIARTCAATGSALHLIRPLGFEIDDRKLKRAGLDYWDKLDIFFYDGIEDFRKKNPEAEVFYFSAKARTVYTDVIYPENVFLMFGNESCGLPEAMIAANPERSIRIPMRGGLRSLNLSNSAAIAVYEVFRQHGFPSLDPEGRPATFSWEEMQS